MISARSFEFGSFLLFPERQLLMRGDAAVRIGARALDLLTALVERPGELVSKTDLMARAWPSTTVDEGNLKVNMVGLRRALDDDADAARYIATVTGRGYRFVAPVRTRDMPESGQRTCARLVDLPPDPGSDRLAQINALVGAAGYGIVIDGEMTLQLNETVVLLKPGSVVARRGANHPASVAGRPCRMLVVQIDG
jgi:DNA-binding winged helix-turn-helix (wHTH) protein